MRDSERRILVLGGASGAGKTTLALGVTAQISEASYIVPRSWPALRAFNQDPTAWAFDNQMQALDVAFEVLETARQASSRIVLVDFAPVRVFMVHTRSMHEEGLLSNSEFGVLEERYTEMEPTHPHELIVVDAPVDVLHHRVSQRRREEDSTFGYERTRDVRDRWLDVADRCARKGWQVSLLDSDRDESIVIEEFTQRHVLRNAY